MKLFNTIAYHSTKQKNLLEFEDFTSESKAKTGEGAMIHGWGLYLQSDKQSNKESYLFPFAGYYPHEDDVILNFNGNIYYGKSTEDICDINDDTMESVTVHDWYTDKDFENPQRDYGELFLDIICYSGNDFVSTFESIIDNESDSSCEVYHHLDTIEARSFVKYFKNHPVDVKVDYLQPDTPEHFENASQYTIEIPDNFVFLNEDEELSDDSLRKLGFPYVSPKKFYESIQNKYPQLTKRVFMDYLRSAQTDNDYDYDVDSFIKIKNYNKGTDYDLSENDIKNVLKEIYDNKNNIKSIFFDGERIYKYLSSKFGGDREASEYLLSKGFDGIEYKGGRDDLCYVIFNCKDLKILKEE